jgi:hypothetical protein
MTNMKPGSFAFFLGIGLLGLALVGSVAFGAIVGGPLVVGALALVTRGLTARRRKAAGKPCAACPRMIVFEHEAEFCRQCSLPLHGACAATHWATAHGPAEGHPFR